jgi:hypothetical protein
MTRGDEIVEVLKLLLHEMESGSRFHLMRRAEELATKLREPSIGLCDLNLVANLLGGGVEHCPSARHRGLHKAGRLFTVRTEFNEPDLQRFGRTQASRLIGGLLASTGYLIDWARWDQNPDGKIDLSMMPLTSSRHFAEESISWSLLMPEFEFRDVCRANCVGGAYDPVAIAAHFCVPPSLAALRGRWLNIMSWE